MDDSNITKSDFKSLKGIKRAVVKKRIQFEVLLSKNDIFIQNKSKHLKIF